MPKTLVADGHVCLATIQHGAEEQFLDLSSFVFPKMYDEQEMFGKSKPEPNQSFFADWL